MSSIADPQAYFDALGGLHDVNIDRLAIDIEASTLTLQIDDLRANFANPPPVPPQSATIVFAEVIDLRLAFDLREGVRIGSLEIRRFERGFELRLALSSGGIPDDDATWWVSARFGSVSLVENTQ